MLGALSLGLLIAYTIASMGDQFSGIMTFSVMFQYVAVVMTFYVMFQYLAVVFLAVLDTGGISAQALDL